MALTDATPTAGGTPPPDLGGAACRAAYFLPPDRRTVGRARHLVTEQLGLWGVAPDDCDTAVLVVSELLTNAVLHTNSRRVACTLGATPDLVLIQVTDDGSGPSAPRTRRAGSRDEAGRGLLLVRALSEHWGVGVAEYGGGRTVWATLRTARP
ncbi:ATP-binding protein [Streptomyces sp. NPDC085927]|uniref:ATP-binding protein n=1 Tax=Streptomyces sp. NPDC085927 TaxID=3365738 RepID=UPI0037D6FEEF